MTHPSNRVGPRPSQKAQGGPPCAGATCGSSLFLVSCDRVVCAYVWIEIAGLNGKVRGRMTSRFAALFISFLPVLAPAAEPSPAPWPAEKAAKGMQVPAGFT